MGAIDLPQLRSFGAQLIKKYELLLKCGRLRYKNNDYSAPMRYGHQAVLAKGYVDRVEIVCRDETIAVHPRRIGPVFHLHPDSSSFWIPLLLVCQP
jgi:hypothetical protein